MTEHEERIIIAEIHGFRDIQTITGYLVGYFDGVGDEHTSVPEYHYDLDALQEVEKYIGLHDRNNLELRVKWINSLRTIVGRRCPKNKMGASIVSDVDLLNAYSEERVEAVLKIMGKIPKNETR